MPTINRKRTLIIACAIALLLSGGLFASATGKWANQPGTGYGATRSSGHGQTGTRVHCLCSWTDSERADTAEHRLCRRLLGVDD